MNNNNSFNSSSILQPSDLFGKEILPECTFESEYGKLKFNAVVVPDFSKDKIELELLTKQFDDIKAFMKEEDLLKKRTIAVRLFLEPRRFVPSIDKDEVVLMGNFFTNSQSRQMDFRNLLRMSILCRLFETGVSMRYNICLEFGFDPFDDDTKEKLSQGERIKEVLKQPQYKPMAVEYQIIIIYAATKKYLLDIPVDDVLRFQDELFDFIDTKYSEIPEEIREKKEMSKELEEKLAAVITEFRKQFH
jgi:hypothetical protein